ncbi:MAG: hypothetical protein A2370_01340 [Candidatus Vogelbacteria bacterium RIFOXYB1_FULL_42_16]|uniref:Glutamyl-tRNA amidotransferase n=2 Tax=Candidatus Vogeliibacteriota TaxID=1817922 RepID=A0A1G2QCN3_9BACT|nr:MAG: hypothetical protein A2607_00900 [Candidatus Vogelbacteria bacterium RIFOXYD1_FULL_42_15]OHA58345.1 MAG: hypothetical protein A2370_01340 [Candidatus Vogelbacteria bacterium RIFOXYB1_FULL_42_16]
MSLHEQIKNEIKEALKARDEVRLATVRGMSASLTNELVTKKMKPTEILTDDDVLIVIKRLVKQRQDSIEQFRAGNREDLASAEEAELNILKTYLPAQMSEEQIRAMAESKKAELGITDKTKIGILTGAVMKATGGQADGNVVKQIVESLF